MDDAEPRGLALDAGVAEGMRRMGVSEEDIAAQAHQRAPVASGVFEVHADCWDSVMFWLMVQTQWVWRAVGMGGSVRAGLNNCAVLASMEMADVRKKQRPALFDDLRTMEREVLRLVNEALELASNKGNR